MDATLAASDSTLEMEHESIFGTRILKNHDFCFDIFQYVVGSLFPDSFLRPGRPLELSNQLISMTTCDRPEPSGTKWNISESEKMSL